MQIFPCSDCTIDDLTKWVCELKTAGLILEYLVEQDGYWFIIGFKRHQKIDKPTAKYPLPNHIADHSLSRTRGLVENAHTSRPLPDDGSVSTSLMLDEVSHSGLPRNVKEGNVMDIDISKVPKEILPVCQDENSGVVQDLFQYWRVTLKHPRAKLDITRARKITAAMKLGFSVAELKQAIDGCSMSTFHMGQNDRTQKYDDIGLIFRNAEKIEMFIGLSVNDNSSDSIVSHIDQMAEGAI